MKSGSPGEGLKTALEDGIFSLKFGGIRVGFLPDKKLSRVN